MRPTTLSSLVVALLVAASCARPAVDPAAEERTIRELDRRWVHTAIDRDTVKMAAFYAEDGELLPPNAPRVSRRGAPADRIGSRAQGRSFSELTDGSRLGDMVLTGCPPPPLRGAERGNGGGDPGADQRAARRVFRGHAYDVRLAARPSPSGHGL